MTQQPQQAAGPGKGRSRYRAAEQDEADHEGDGSHSVDGHDRCVACEGVKRFRGLLCEDGGEEPEVPGDCEQGAAYERPRNPPNPSRPILTDWIA